MALCPRPAICGKMNHIQWLSFRPASSSRRPARRQAPARRRSVRGRRSPPCDLLGNIAPPDAALVRCIGRQPALSSPSDSPRRARPPPPNHVPCARPRSPPPSPRRRRRRAAAGAAAFPVRPSAMIASDARTGSPACEPLIALNLPSRRAMRGLRIGVDRLLRRLQGTAGPVGAERAGLDDDHLDPKGPTSLDSDSDRPSTANLVAA